MLKEVTVILAEIEEYLLMVDRACRVISTDDQTKQIVVVSSVSNAVVAFTVFFS